ncbi:MBOAT family protein [Saprospiraceae bacterium]|nr:MBOAT family protein [Saprospiraceae bacterium]
MSFNSFGGIWFSLAVLLVYQLIKGHKNQNIFLLCASLYFYATSSILFSSLLFATIYIGFTSGLIINHALEKGKSARLHVTMSIIAQIITLGIFKYHNFFVESFATTLNSFGLNPNFSTLKIILPVGISFYIFQTIGYIIDVARKDTKAHSDIVEFALFVSFFPQLVAGPIERSKNLLSQIASPREQVGKKDVTYGVFLIIQGYVKKVVIADNLAPYVDTIFTYDNISSPIICVGLLLFAIQIYGDFSGYTDIARGFSRLLGFRILLNFDRPYAARSPADFWRRWHISLSRWFTEYVYIGLGGNRSKSALRRNTNVMATMTLSGLWHGASLNFILWGAYHGVVILIGRIVGKISPNFLKNSTLGTLLSIIITFMISLYGWMYFRITSIDQLIEYNKSLIMRWDGYNVALSFLAQSAPFLILWLVLDIVELYWLDVHAQKVKRYRWITLYMGIMLMIVFILHAPDPSSFIYFRF